MPDQVDVALEITRRRTFAVAVAWPGWTRAGRTEEEALEALWQVGPRYASALAESGVSVLPPADRAALVVVDRVPGNGGTEFGVPSVPLSRDDAPLDAEELEHGAAIVRAAWAAFDAAARRHAADTLRTGPRGGGRDLPRMVEHIREADEAYLAQLGARPPKDDGGPVSMESLRGVAIATLRARALGLPIENARRTARPWSPRWYMRRAAWHALDHAWEIEDRAIRPST